MSVPVVGAVLKGIFTCLARSAAMPGICVQPLGPAEVANESAKQRLKRRLAFEIARLDGVRLKYTEASRKLRRAETLLGLPRRQL